MEVNFKDLIIRISLKYYFFSLFLLEICSKTVKRVFLVFSRKFSALVKKLNAFLIFSSLQSKRVSKISFSIIFLNLNGIFP